LIYFLYFYFNGYSSACTSLQNHASIAARKVSLEFWSKIPLDSYLDTLITLLAPVLMSLTDLLP